MHAIMVTVDIDADRSDEADRMLHEQVVPTTAAQQGHVGSFWLRTSDRTKGISISVFQSEQDAKVAVDGMQLQGGPPADAPVSVASIGMLEVIASA